MLHTTCYNYYNSSQSLYLNPSLPSTCYYSCCSCCCCFVANNSTTFNTYDNHLPYFPRTNNDINININVNTNPSSFLYNNRLRQSTLIKFSPTRRRLVTHGSASRIRQVCDRNSSNARFLSDGRDSYEKVRKLGRKTRYVCQALEDSSTSSSEDEVVDEVEILLDLLNENAGFREKKERDGRRVGERKKNVRKGGVTRETRCEDKGVEVRGTKEEERRISLGKGFSGSSYYSVLDTDEYESENDVDVDVEVKRDDKFVRGESSSEYKDELKMSSYKRHDEDVKEKERNEILKKTNEKTYYGNQEWRKASEKKLDIESSQHNSERSDMVVDQSRSGMKYKRFIEKLDTDNRFIGSSSSAQRRYSDTENKLITRAERADHVTRQDEYKRQTNVVMEASQIHEFDRRETRMKNREDSYTEISSRIEDQREDDQQKIDQLTALKESRVQSQHISDTRINKTENTSVLRRQSEIRSEKQEQQLETKMKSWEDDLIEISGRVEDRREDKQQNIDQSTSLKESRVQSEHISEISDTLINKTENTSVSRRQSDIRSEKREWHLETSMKNWEDNLIEISGRVEDRKEEKQQNIDRLNAFKESRVKSQHISDISDTRINKTENTLVSRRQSDIRNEKQELRLENRTKNQEDDLTEVSGRVEDQREDKQKIDQLTALKESRVQSQQISETSDSSISKTENTSVSRRQSDTISETRMKNREDDLTEVTGSIVDRREENKQKFDYLTALKESRVKSQVLDISEISDTTENTLVSGRQSDIRSNKQELQSDTSVSQGSSSGIKMLEGTTDFVKPGRRTTKASSFNVGMPREASSSYKALKLNPEPKSQETGAHVGGSSSSLSIVSTSSAGEIQEPSRDAIASADKQQISSSHYVGEFVRKAKHELLISEVQQENKTTEADLVYEHHEQHELGSSGEDASGNSDPKIESAGPSDEIWHETAASIDQPMETDAPDNTFSTETGDDESVKKSGRSLWNVIGDVVRLRWASPRSDTHTPEMHTPKSGGGKASSIQSTSSDAWFSGHEPEDSNDDNMKTGSKKGRSRRQKDGSNPSSSKNTSPRLIAESSFPSPAIRMRQSPVATRTSGIDETDASTSGTIDQLVSKPLTKVPQADASGSGKMVILDQVPVSGGVTDGELKRRKLGRIDQVSKDRFDEWEEAYTFEAKQRKDDEHFMREALSEANKAADFWEVPVGAVLVKDGKVIARGYNLVEELRDSTAHAEMICIHEASNNLRSWRLSGCTLYVTLEPCPMCAGAILQARVDTVVWGAPNKLLGADGSWIRLFPDGDGGNSDKQPAPVHPFHPNMTIRRGVLSAECADVMQQFFQLRRKKKEKRTETEPTQPPSSSLPITHHHRSKFFSKMQNAFTIMFCL